MDYLVSFMDVAVIKDCGDLQPSVPAVSPVAGSEL